MGGQATNYLDFNDKEGSCCPRYKSSIYQGMRKKLLWLGKSLAMVLDRQLLNLVGVEPKPGAEIEFDIEVQGNVIMLTPVHTGSSTNEEFDAELVERALRLIMRLRSDRDAPVSPDIAGELEILQRHVAMQLEGRDVDPNADPRVVADDSTFRPGKLVDRLLADQFLARTVRAIRTTSRAGEHTAGTEAPPAMPVIEVENRASVPHSGSRADRYRTGRRG